MSLFHNRSKRFVASIIFTLIACAFAWKFLLKQASPPNLRASAVPNPIALPDIPFVSAHADLQKLSDTNNKWTLLFFGFTHCPDICPTTLAYLDKEYSKLLELRPGIKIVFISVDTEGDTADSTMAFAQKFNPMFYGVTASDEDLRRLTKDVGAYFNKDSGSNLHKIAHSGDMFLINPKGEWFAYYRPPLEPGAVEDDLRTLALKY